ncbi:hypothetical protein [Streptomyces sp. NPDC096030]|uniref:hypothetical protein n=1 Tax=Streptomyces sp. NPDC096030 TaxID=3155423 RepID=UPI003323038D
MITVLTYFVRRGRAPRSRVDALLDRIQVEVEVFADRRDPFQDVELAGLRQSRGELNLALRRLRAAHQSPIVVVLDRLDDYLGLGADVVAQADTSLRHEQRRAEKRLLDSIGTARQNLGLR